MSQFFGTPDGMDAQRSGPNPWDHLQQKDQPTDDGAPNKGPAYGQENAYALPVNQRSAKNWNGNTLLVDGSVASSIVPRQRGRVSFTVVVPSTAPAGVYVGSGEGVLESTPPQGFYIPVGGGLTVNTEGPCYAISGTNGLDTVVCVVTCWG